MVVNVTKFMEDRNRVTFDFIKFFSIYLGCVSCFCFCKITVFISGNTPLIFRIINTKTDIYFFLTRKLLFFLLCAFIYNFIVDCFFNYICHLKYLFCSISFIVMSIMNGNCNFISNNVKGIKVSEKRLKLF